MSEHASLTTRAVLRRWPVVVGSIVVFAIAFAVAAGRTSTTWTSTTEVLYSESTSQLLTESPASSDVQRTLATQAEIVTGDAVMKPAASDLGISEARLVSLTTVDDQPGSDVLSVQVRGTDPEEAARRSQRVADGYVALMTDQSRTDLNKQAKALQSTIDVLEAQLQDASSTSSAGTAGASNALAALVQQQSLLSAAAASAQGPASVISDAAVPQSPTSPTRATGGVLGAVVGLLLGAGLAFVLGRPRRRGAADAAGGDGAQST